MVEFFFYI